MMTQLERSNINSTAIIFGSLFLILGFGLLSAFTWAWWALFIGAALAWLVVFKRASLAIFTKPHKLWLIPIGVVAYLALGVVVGLIARSLGFHWTINPASGHVLQLLFKIPFMLMGEELLGIGVLEVAHNKGLSLLNSNLLSALIFALMHVLVYWDGSIVSTLLHVLLLQGVARLIFNTIYLKAGHSIWASWLTHVLVDLVALSL